MPNHAVIVREVATSVSTPATVETGIPFIVGAAPVHNAENPATPGVPTLVTTFAEFVDKLGWSDDWASYNLCEFAYAHFKLYGMSPAIFLNLLDPATNKTAVAAASKTVVAKKVALTVKAIDDAGLVVQDTASPANTLVKDTDYSVYYAEDGKLTVELLPDSTHYSDATLSIAYNEVTPASVNATAVAAGFDKADLCMTVLGLIPDLLVAPGYSDTSTVAAVMATKAAGINGMFKAKAVIDVSTASSGGADEYSEVVGVKTSNNLFDSNEIVCWPMVKLGDLTFHLSSHIPGVIATTDNEYGGAPYVSPSNKALKCDKLVVIAGTEVILSLDQANILNANGVVTALNFMGGFKLWGNYTACYPGVQDVKDYFIPVNRMFDWVGNTLIKTFWDKLDEAMNRRLLDSILDSANIWLNGLVGAGYLLGARAEMLESENPVTDLMAGIVRIHIYITPPSPAQEIDFLLEYDASYVTEALA